MEHLSNTNRVELRCVCDDISLDRVRSEWYTMSKLTKAQAKRRLMEIRQKAAKLFNDDFISVKDFTAIERITKLRRNQLK